MLVAFVIVLRFLPKFADNRMGDVAVNSNSISVKWTIDVFRGGRFDQTERLTTDPAAVYTGDSIHVTIDLSESAYIYAYWIGSDGTVSVLFPESPGAAILLSTLEFPGQSEFGLPVVGGSGTEVCLLVLRGDACDPDTLVDTLKPIPTIPPIGNRMLIVGESSGELNESPYPGVSRPFEKLKGVSRPVGNPQPILGKSARAVISEWVQSLSRDVGSVHYIAISHLNRSPS